MFASHVGPASHIFLKDIADLRPERRQGVEGEVLFTLSGLATPAPERGGRGGALAGRSYNVCVPGDIVGTGRTWTVVPRDMGEQITGLDVVRLRASYVSSVDVVCEWLNSSDAAQQAMGAGVVRLLRPDLMVPRQIVEDRSLHEAATTLRTIREDARRLVNGLFDDPFRGSPDVPTATTRLVGLTSRARAIGRLLEPLNDIVQRAELTYPHQIAELARYYRLEDSSRSQVQAAVRLVEAIARELGALAGSAMLSAGRNRDDVLGPFKKGGVSSGNWVQMVRDAQRLNDLGDLPELAGMGFGKRGVGAVLNRGVELRNRFAHAHGVLSDEEAKELHGALEPILVELLDGMVWLSTVDHLYVRSCQYWGDPPSLEISGSLLTGAHPVWERRTVPITDPMTPERVVALLPSNSQPLSLHPLVTVAACTECRREEAFVLDQIDENRAIARSIRDHSRIMTL